MALETILAGDLGGTKTLLMLMEREGKQPLLEHRYENANYSGLGQILKVFLEEAKAGKFSLPVAACLGVAGPVKEGAAIMTNLGWAVSESDLIRSTGVRQARVINDFEAAGRGLECLEPDEIVELQPGKPQEKGVRAVIGAGTGLGEAILLPAHQGWKVLATEGAHVDFAPRDEFEAGLWRWLRQRYGHVSYERIVSGDGLVNIYGYLLDVMKMPVSAELAEAMGISDPATAISEFGISGADAAAVKTVDTFISVYGAEAGNLALKCLPHGGLYIAGGIAPKLVKQMSDGRFLGAFRDKGRFADLMVEFPVRLVINPRLGLLGAAREADGLPV